MNKKQIIVFLPRFTFGGAGNSVFKIIKFLEKNKYQVSIICLKKCDYAKKFEKKTKVYELKHNRVSSSLFAIFKILKKYSRKEKDIFLYSNHHYANCLSIILKAFIKNLKVISVERTCLKELTIYFSFKDFLKKNILNFLLKALYKYSDLNISNTKYTKYELKKIKNLKKVVQIYAPTLTKIKPFKKKKIKNFVNLIWVGRLDKEKGLEDLIIATRYINYLTKISIIGSGIMYNKYKNMITNKNQNNKTHIRLISNIKNSESYHSQAHILINTSFFEGSNNAIIESINNNNIIIASDTPGGNKEILNQNKFGVLYKKNSSLDLAKKINFVIKNMDKFQNKLKKNKNYLTNFLEKKNVYKTCLEIKKLINN